MPYKFFSKNGQVLPARQAVVPIDNIAFAYGFGVYETIRVDKGTIYFPNEHLGRLLQSAQIIGLEHRFNIAGINDSISELIQKNKTDTCNIKILLVGGASKDQANLYIMCLNPLFPDRKLYRDGAKLITYEAERPFAHAKSLNMLQSYLAYRQAKENDAYDALLIDRNGHITEGTRTNFFVVIGRTLISPPEDKILMGVMRKIVLKVAQENNFKIRQFSIKPTDLENYDSAFLTSTSSKIMPVKSIDGNIFTNSSPELRELMKMTGEFLTNCKGELS